MTETAQTPPYTLGSDEKVAQVMAYTASAFYWGEVVVKEMIRVSTWLRTNTAPDRFCLFNARAMLTTGAPTRPMQFSELHIATSQVLMFHMVPPAKDPPDYDPTEPNRYMQPVSLLIGSFRVDGNLRLSTRSNISKFLEITRESFTSVYDARVSNPALPAFGSVAVPYLIVRQEVAVFALP
jgi:hypothetical protein